MLELQCLFFCGTLGFGACRPGWELLDLLEQSGTTALTHELNTEGNSEPFEIERRCI